MFPTDSVLTAERTESVNPLPERKESLTHLRDGAMYIRFPRLQVKFSSSPFIFGANLRNLQEYAFPEVLFSLKSVALHMQSDLLDAFYAMIPDTKKRMFDRIAAQRTRHLTVVLENIYQEHNASAVMRSCESFGVQELHVVENRNEYKVQRDIARGAGRWVELSNYSEGEPLVDCINGLKKRGFCIAALTPDADSHSIFDLPLDQPVALVFGTEWEGISETVRSMADVTVQIPMVGFTESFNVSVSVALTLQALRHRLENSDLDWKLSEEEQVDVKLDWCEAIMKNGTSVRAELNKRLAEQL